MTDFNYSTVKGTSFAFDPAADTLDFGSAASAAELVIASGANGLVITGPDGVVTTLTGTSIDQVAVSRFTFNDDSILRIGDGLATTAADDSAQVGADGAGTANDDQIIGLGGADNLTGLAGDDKILGGEGNDTIDGGADDDRIRANKGDDSITGTAGNDNVFGGAGNDNIDYSGSAGRNLLKGDLGQDTLLGGTGDDTIFGGDEGDTITEAGGDNELRGEEGADTITGSTGRDSVFGGSGADVITGLAGRDELRGNEGADNIDGGADDDVIYGGKGSDTLDGGAADDAVYGDVGADTITSSAGNDTLTGGSGADKFYVVDLDADGDTVEIADYVAADDTIYVDTDNDSSTNTAATAFTADRTNSNGLELNGGDTDSLVLKGITSGIVTLTARDTGGRISVNMSNTSALLEGPGSGTGDLLVAGNGGDTLDGGAGADKLVGGEGNDSVDGGEGADTISSGDGNDTIVGGSTAAQADEIDAGAGNDVVTIRSDTTADVKGGAGDDVLNINAVNGYAYDLDGDDAANDISGFETINVTGTGTITLDFDATYVTAGDIAATDTVTIDGSTMSNTPVLTLTDTGDAGVKLSIVGSSGNDAITLDTTTTTINVSGGEGNDAITTGSAADTINGGAGNDTLHANGGLNSVTGGLGADTYQFDDQGTANLTTLVDFSISGVNGVDVISAEDTTFGLDGTLDDFYSGAAAAMAAGTAYDVVVITDQAYADAAAVEDAIHGNSTSNTAAIVVFLDTDGFAYAFYDSSLNTDGDVTDANLIAKINTITGLAGTGTHDIGDLTIANFAQF